MVSTDNAAMAKNGGSGECQNSGADIATAVWG